MLCRRAQIRRLCVLRPSTTHKELCQHSKPNIHRITSHMTFVHKYDQARASQTTPVKVRTVNASTPTAPSPPSLPHTDQSDNAAQETNHPRSAGPSECRAKDGGLPPFFVKRLREWDSILNLSQASGSHTPHGPPEAVGNRVAGIPVPASHLSKATPASLASRTAIPASRIVNGRANRRESGSSAGPNPSPLASLAGDGRQTVNAFVLDNSLASYTKSSPAGSAPFATQSHVLPHARRGDKGRPPNQNSAGSPSRHSPNVENDQISTGQAANRTQKPNVETVESPEDKGGTHVDAGRGEARGIEIESLHFAPVFELPDFGWLLRLGQSDNTKNS
jgi:hypothetical protein